MTLSRSNALGTTDVSDSGWRLYLLLALFDRRGSNPLDDLVRSAREGYERSHPDMNEAGAWDEFDALWRRFSSAERLRLAEAYR